MQSSLSRLEYAAKKNVTQRDQFLAVIEAVTRWTELVMVLEPSYPRSKACKRPPIGFAWLLRMYSVQQCFGLSDQGMEDAIYDCQPIRCFIGNGLKVDAAFDATLLLKFRCLLETH